MSAVGLSFGSPTSGQGFDVSTTVASIVSNLKNIETPWNTQLATLSKQDTTISSLGTLFSNLSNDVSALTDMSGIMAQKEGSSSDQNVLTLTAANNNAVAGTHVVVVTSLAKTSSGYLAPIGNASDTLAGSITLQAGSGTAQTITLGSSDYTLAGLAAAINASGVGIIASVLTDSSGSRLSLVSGTSGANGNIAITNNTITDTTANLKYSGTAGTASTASTGTLTSIVNANDALTGSLKIAVGNGATQTFTIGSGSGSPPTYYTGTGSGDNTLAALASTINTASIGVTAAVVTNSNGTSSLSLTSNNVGSSNTLNVTSGITDTSMALGYTSPLSGADAVLSVDGVSLTSSTNTVANLIPGVTFQLLAPSANESDGSLEQVQVVIANNNAGVVSTVSSLISDYNALISAVNTQEGNDSSGNPEPLFGSPTLSLLQQQLLSGMNTQNPNGYLTSVTEGTGTKLSGTLSIQVGTGTPQTITIDSSNNTLSTLAAAINNTANLGVTATVVTTGNQSTLSLASQTEGSSGGALTVLSHLTAVGYTALNYSGLPATTNGYATGTLTGITHASDTLTGSITIGVGGGATQTVAVPSSGATLASMATAITNANIGVTASVVTNSNGTSSLSLLSNTMGSAGNLTVTSNILDTTQQVTTAMNYNNSSDINSTTTMGFSVNNDGSISLNATSLDSILNSDYSSVVGFFQNANSWGNSFAAILANSGTSSSSGALALASNSNSNIESTLNADISKENSLISIEQKSLTAALNSANEIMQAIPQQLQGMNELYSAITGYNQQN